MRPMHRAAAAALAVALLVPLSAHAAGYGIYEQGGAALGMAGANTASVHDASALFFNPAALPRLRGTQLSLGGTWLSTRTSFAGIQPYPGFGTIEEMKPGNFFPPTLYLTGHLGARWAWGLGANSPFGLGVEWKDPEKFTGRESVTKALLQTLNGNFSLAWAPNDRWSLAAGADALFAKVELNSIGTFVTNGGQPVNVSRAKLDSDFKPGYGFNLGLLATPVDGWRVGVTYRSEIDVDVDDGRADFTQIRTGDPVLDATVAAGLPADQGVATRLVFPALLAGGIAWEALPGWTWEGDAIWTQWSAFEKLPLRFAKNASLDRDIVENYQDQVQVRVGAEHRLERYTYRFGYYFDQAAAPVESLTPLLPDANRHGATLGLGLGRGNWTLDLYNLFLFVEKRTTEGRERAGFDGVYKTYVNALGANLAYRW